MWMRKRAVSNEISGSFGSFGWPRLHEDIVELLALDPARQR
jgi:hypothetical protein